MWHIGRKRLCTTRNIEKVSYKNVLPHKHLKITSLLLDVGPIKVRTFKSLVEYFMYAGSQI